MRVGQYPPSAFARATQLEELARRRRGALVEIGANGPQGRRDQGRGGSGGRRQRGRGDRSLRAKAQESDGRDGGGKSGSAQDPCAERIEEVPREWSGMRQADLREPFHERLSRLDADEERSGSENCEGAGDPEERTDPLAGAEEGLFDADRRRGGEKPARMQEQLLGEAEQRQSGDDCL